MGRRAPSFTKAELTRALAAAAEAGPDYAVRVSRDGTIEIYRRSAPEKREVAYNGPIRL